MAYEQDPDQVDKEEANAMWESWQEWKEDSFSEEWVESQYEDTLEQICSEYGEGRFALYLFDWKRKKMAESVASQAPPRNRQDLRHGYNCAVYNKVLEMTEEEKVERELQDMDMDDEFAREWLIQPYLGNEKIDLLERNDEDNSFNLPSV